LTPLFTPKGINIQNTDDNIMFWIDVLKSSRFVLRQKFQQMTKKGDRSYYKIAKIFQISEAITNNNNKK